MTRKKNAKTTIHEEAAPALAELLADGDDSQRFDFDGVDWSQLGRLIASAAGMGAMVSAWVGSANGRFCLSLRAGDRKRSYDFDTAEEVNVWVPMLLKKLGPPAAPSQNGKNSS